MPRSPVFAGLREMILAALCFSLMGVCVKEARLTLAADQVVFVRSAVCLALTLWMLRGVPRGILGNRTGLLLVRGCLGYAGLLLMTEAIGLAPYADVVALLATNPLFAALFAALLFTERLPRRAVVALVASLAGAALILRPGFNADLFGAGLALAGGVVSGLAYAVVRGLSRTEKPATIVLWFPLVALPIAAVRMLDDWIWPTPWLWLVLVAVGFLAQGGQVFLTRALAVQKAGIATASSFLGLLLSALWGFTFFGEIPHLLVWPGAAVIVASTWWLGRSADRVLPATAPGPEANATPTAGGAPRRTVG